MDLAQIGKQMFAMQKTAFNHSMDAMLMLMDQNARVAESWGQKGKQTSGRQAENSSVWIQTVKQNMEVYREMVNKGFDSMNSVFSSPNPPAKDPDEED